MTSYLGAASFWLMTGRSATTLEKATVSIRPMKTPSLFFLRLPILAMKYLHKFRAMPLFRKSKRRCRLDHYLIAAPSNPVYRIVFLTKFRSSLVSRSNKQTRGSAASEDLPARRGRSEDHTSELKSLMRNSYAVFCLIKKTTKNTDE